MVGTTDQGGFAHRESVTPRDADCPSRVVSAHRGVLMAWGSVPQARRGPIKGRSPATRPGLQESPFRSASNLLVRASTLQRRRPTSRGSNNADVAPITS